MIAQAKKDEKYANIAGGILAGMVPTNTAVNGYFIRKSLFRGLIFPFKGTFGIFTFLKNTITFGASSFFLAIKQRAEYWNWIKNIFSSILSAIKLYNKRQNEKPNSLKHDNYPFFKIETETISAINILPIENPNKVHSQK